MEVKNGIIIDGVLHEMIDAFTINFGCSKCSLRKECDECEMRHETYLCTSKAWVLRSNRNGITYKTQLITQYKLLIFSCVFAFYKQDVFHIRF